MPTSRKEGGTRGRAEEVLGTHVGFKGDQEPAVAATSSSGAGGGILQLELLAAAGVPCKVAVQSAGVPSPWSVWGSLGARELGSLVEYWPCE